MSNVFEEFAKEIRQEEAAKTKRETSLDSAKNLIKLGKLSAEEIARCVDLPVEEIKALADKKPA